MARKNYTRSLDQIVADASLAIKPESSGDFVDAKALGRYELLMNSVNDVASILKGTSRSGTKVKSVKQRFGIANDYRSDINSRLSRLTKRGFIDRREARTVRLTIDRLLDLGDRHQNSQRRSNYTTRLENFKTHYHANLSVANQATKSDYMTILDDLTLIMQGKKVKNYNERTTSARLVLYDLSSKLLTDVKEGRLTSKEAYDITQATGNIIRTGFNNSYAKKKHRANAESLDRLNNRISLDFGVEAATGIPASLLRVMGRQARSLTVFPGNGSSTGNYSKSPAQPVTYLRSLTVDTDNNRVIELEPVLESGRNANKSRLLLPDRPAIAEPTIQPSYFRRPKIWTIAASIALTALMAGAVYFKASTPDKRYNLTDKITYSPDSTNSALSIINGSSTNSATLNSKTL